MCGTIEYQMWSAAKQRATARGIPFDIEPKDIHIPAVCSLLNTPLISGRNKGQGWSPNSPSLDRKIPSLGYTKENVWVISGRANVMKSDSAIEEMRTLLRNWEGSL
jgi:hypothetical protein